MTNIQPIQLWILTAWLCIGIGLLVIFIFAYLQWERLTRIRKNRWITEFGDLVTAIIVCESKEELETAWARPDIQLLLARRQHKKEGRKVLSEELQKIHKLLSGSAAENIRWLFVQLKFDDDLMEQFKSSKWHIKSAAIQQLAFMGLSQYLTKIYKATNDNNLYVRIEAQLALVRLTGVEGLRFLNVARYPLSPWQQLCLLQELSNHTPPESVKIKRWLQSDNSTVVDFAKKLAAEYPSYDTVDEIQLNYNVAI